MAAAKKRSVPKVGVVAPDFVLADQEGTKHRLKQYRGQWVLLYFYPKDDTTGCTKEACTIRDVWSLFKKQKTVVLGVSADSEMSHAKFAKKYTLPFPLLADVEKLLIQAYGVWGEKKFMGRTYQGIHRMSFLIDPKGKIAKVYEKVKPAQHAAEVLRDINILTKT